MSLLSDDRLVKELKWTRRPFGLKFRLNVKGARKEMLIAGLKKSIHLKPTDLGLWKKG
jgi:hypothetical protein